MNASDNKLWIPGAIIIAGLIIAGAIVLSGGMIDSERASTDTASDVAKNGIVNETNRPRPVSSDDHIRGNVDAEVVIIEYSDTECPFCKRFHSTMQQVINKYSSSEVAWVYRHFPIPQLHSKAEREAIALECAAKLGGNDAFWAYTDQIYEITPSNDGLDLALLPIVAEEIGLSRTLFETCLEDGAMLEKVRTDRTEAIATGARGTPHSLMLFGENQIVVIEGAQQFEQITAAIDAARAQQ